MSKIRMNDKKMKKYEITKFGDLKLADYYVQVHEDKDGQFVHGDIKKGLPAKVLVRKEDCGKLEYESKSGFKYASDSLSEFRDLQLLGSQKTRSWTDCCVYYYDMEDQPVIRLGCYGNDPFITDVRSGKIKVWINHHGKKQTLDQSYRRGS